MFEFVAYTLWRSVLCVFHLVWGLAPPLAERSPIFKLMAFSLYDFLVALDTNTGHQQMFGLKRFYYMGLSIGRPYQCS